MTVVVLVHGTDLRLDVRRGPMPAELLPIKLLQAGEGAGSGHDTLQRSELAAPDGPRWQLPLQSHGGRKVACVIVVDLVVRQDGVHGLEGAAAGRPVAAARGRRRRRRASLATSSIAGSLRAQAVSTHLFLELYCRRLLPNTILIL
jgi:hypothetical protein